MPVFTDQMGRHIALDLPPRRIVSLVPSQTELLFDLGLQKRIAGITKFCIHPAEARAIKTIIGGTKQFRMEVIHRLQPDLIIGNKEENYQEGIEELSRHYPVWMSDIFGLDDALAMIRSIGELTETRTQAATIAQEIADGFAALTAHPTHRRVLYLIWHNPWMAAGKQTFIDDMLQRGGWQNAVTESRYPELSEADMRNLAPDCVFLSSEPFPFREKHIAHVQAIVPHAKILLVDGELFSWYGSRLRHSAAYLADLRLRMQT
ncbi:helical backbone metal receptor [Rhodoflexus caldus]|uniref:helical backbone metal receptor n=1 Tax=Rhodoflexus caldus TaxID=2891236 RepID=UPI00202A069C|nr:helical backbone metal receptor [Rhodoflexus caldus]